MSDELEKAIRSIKNGDEETGEFLLGKSIQNGFAGSGDETVEQKEISDNEKYSHPCWFSRVWVKLKVIFKIK